MEQPCQLRPQLVRRAATIFTRVQLDSVAVSQHVAHACCCWHSPQSSQHALMAPELSGRQVKGGGSCQGNRHAAECCAGSPAHPGRCGSMQSAQMVLALAAQKGLGARLHPRHPILEAEVAYCAQVSRKWYLRCSCSCFAQNGCAARLLCMTAYAGDVVAVPTELQVFKVQQGAVRVHRALT